MKAKGGELVLIEKVRSGEWEIDDKGRVWRVACRRGDGWRGGARLIPCKRRRAGKISGGGYIQPDDVLDGERILSEHLRIGERMDKVGHPCDEDADTYAPWSEEHPNPLPWRSPLFMPRTASRLTLKVEEARIERLQSIDDAGIYAEGFHWRSGGAELSSEHEIVEREARRSLFHDAWNEMSRREGEAFEDDPWVWVVRFSVVEHWT